MLKKKKGTGGNNYNTNSCFNLMYTKSKFKLKGSYLQVIFLECLPNAVVIGAFIFIAVTQPWVEVVPCLFPR